MLKEAFDRGTNDALRAFGLEKHAVIAIPKFKPAAPLGKDLGFFGKAKAHGGNLVEGVKSWLNPAPEQLGSMSLKAQGQHTANQVAGKAQAWESAKGLLPAAGLAAGGLFLGSKLLGKSPEEKAREQQARMGQMG